MGKKKLKKQLAALTKDVKNATDWPIVVCRTKELRAMLKYLKKLERRCQKINERKHRQKDM